MEFGRIDDPLKLANIDWALAPLDSPAEFIQLGRLGRAAAHFDRERCHPPQIFLGTPVWGESEWRGQLYPPGTKNENFLHEYAKQFSTVEVNSTFYAIPTIATIDQWRDAVPEAFRFCPKFPQTVSRSIAHAVQWADCERFADRVKRFGSKLGVSFLQLPPDFTFQSLGALSVFLTHVPRELRTVVEFRHASFFHEQRLRSEVIDLLATHQAGTVITDTAQYRNFAHASLSSLRVLLRYASNNGHSSDTVRVSQWAERIGAWLDRGLKEIYVSVHGTDKRAELEVARNFVRALTAVSQDGQRFPIIPEPLFFDETQGSLFD